MDSRILSVDPESRTTSTHHYDDTTGLTTIETEQDVTELVESNKALYNLVDERTPWAEGRRVASIPMNVYLDLVQKGVTKDPKAFKRWLNDPDNRFFRTSPGTV